MSDHAEIDIYYWPTPNGRKVTILLEELQLKYKVNTVNIGEGEQFNPKFLKIAPNNRIPAIVDHQPKSGKDNISLFESGAILLYLAEKYQKFMPASLEGRAEVLQWLFWQMGGLGPMAGQAHHFRQYATDKIEYAIARYTNEVSRLYGVMNNRLGDRDYLAGEYSIADMACWPWVASYEKQGQDLNDFPHLKRWFNTIAHRDAVKRALAIDDDINKPEGFDKKAREILFSNSKG